VSSFGGASVPASRFHFAGHRDSTARKDARPTAPKKEGTRPFRLGKGRVSFDKLCASHDYEDFTRFKVVACGSVSLPSMIALQVVVMVSGSSK